MIGRILRRGTVAIALFVATAVAPSIAQATTFAPLTIEQVTDGATWIVEGEVQRVWAEIDDRGLVWTRSEIALSTIHKGPASPGSLVVDSLGGQIGDYSTHVPGQAVFSEGESVFLFLDAIEDRVVPVSKFKGKFTLRRATGETRQHAMTWHPNPSERFDHRFLPHPAPEHRLYVDDLRERVQQQLDTGWNGQPIPGISLERLQQLNTLQRRTP